jgi:hypothetical protein
MNFHLPSFLLGATASFIFVTLLYAIDIIKIAGG